MRGVPANWGLSAAEQRGELALQQAQAPGHLPAVAPLLTHRRQSGCRARLAHEQLAASQAALRELAVEHAELHNLRLKDEKEGRQVAELFRAEMTAKGSELVAAQAEVAAAAAALEAMRAAAAEREAALHAAFDAERQSLLVAAAELQARLDGLSNWQEEKQAVETQLVRLQQEKVRAEEQAGEKVRCWGWQSASRLHLGMGWSRPEQVSCLAVSPPGDPPGPCMGGAGSTSLSAANQCSAATTTACFLCWPAERTASWLCCCNCACRFGRFKGACTNLGMGGPRTPRAPGLKPRRARQGSPRLVGRTVREATSACRQTCTACWHTTARWQMRCSSTDRWVAAIGWVCWVGARGWGSSVGSGRAADSERLVRVAVWLQVPWVLTGSAD